MDTAADEATGRLTQLSMGTQTGASTWAEQLTENYNYNPAGQVTSIGETNAGTLVSNQCFAYDGLKQLTEAWTTTAGSVALSVGKVEADLSSEVIDPPAPVAAAEVGVRWLPVPARGDRRRGALVSAVQFVLSRR
jgi:hypothetical protein